MNKQTRTKLPEGTTQVRNASTGEVKQVGSNIPDGAIRDMLFELSCNEDIDSNEFDILFENEYEVTQGFSVNINELSKAAYLKIDTLVAQVAELRGRLNDCVNDYIKNDKGDLTPSVFHRSAVALEGESNE